MQRREFLTGAVAATLGGGFCYGLASAQLIGSAAQCGPTYASPAEAMRSPREKLAYVPGIYTGTEIDEPDYLATVDLDPTSPSYSRVVHRLPMPNVGDELHHFGWNACSSCHGHPGMSRRFLVLPGLRSGRLHIVDAAEPRSPRLHKVIEPEEIAEKANLSAPHTVHCRADGSIMISMLGDAEGNAPGGFLLLTLISSVTKTLVKKTKLYGFAMQSNTPYVGTLNA